MKPEAAYLHGALHDGYIYTGKTKGRVAVITQKNKQWLEEVKSIIEDNEGKAWIFQQREIHLLETKFDYLFHKPLLSTDKEKTEFVSGFFDAEGGIPKKLNSRFYIQFVQKDKQKLELVAKILENFGIKCGKLHQYDKNKSGCWRFYVKANSWLNFLEFIKSKHPEKQKRLLHFKNQLLER